MRIAVEAIWSGTTGLAAAMGPVIAGFLVQAFGWHAVFLMCSPPQASSLH
ncbi:MFS transporter [Tessaracoccus aquimaris]|nr:MFS transporter [Tessaracoccus aquimaris]